MKISFDREEYLSVSSVFENETLDDIETELSEFNEDVEDMAYELAYTRYALAKTERQLAALKAAIENCIEHANGRESEWGDRAMDAFEILSEALAKLEAHDGK